MTSQSSIKLIQDLQDFDQSAASISIAQSNSTTSSSSKVVQFLSKDEEIEDLKKKVDAKDERIQQLQDYTKNSNELIKNSQSIVESKNLIQNLEKEFKEMKNKNIRKDKVSEKLIEFQQKYKNLLQKKIQMSGQQYQLLKNQRAQKDWISDSTRYQRKLEEKNRVNLENQKKNKIELEQKEQKLKDLQMKLKNLPLEYEKEKQNFTAQKKAEIEQEIKQFEQEKECILKQKQEQEDQLKKIQLEFQSKEDQLKQSIEQLEKQKIELKENQEQIQQQFQKNFQDTIEKQQQMITDQNEDISKLTAENEDLLDQKYKYEEQIEQIKRESEEKLEQMQNQNNQNQERILELESLNSEFYKENQELQKSIEKYKVQVQEKVKEFNLMNINLKSEKKEVEKILKVLNPETTFAISQIEFAKQLAVVAQNPLTFEQKQKIQENDLKIMNIFASNSVAANSPNYKKYFSSALMKNYFKQNGINVYISDGINEINPDKQNLQNTILYTGDCRQGKYVSFEFNDPRVLSNYLQNGISFQNYITSLKNEVGNHLNIDQQERQNKITVMRVSIDPTACIELKINDQEDKIEQKLKNFFSKGLSVWVKNLIDNSTLSTDMFDPNHDIDWRNFQKGSYEFRGALPIYSDLPKLTPHKYYFPIGFKGYGLNVINKYGPDKRWLEKTPDIQTWIVLFHGTSDKKIESILTSYLRPGQRDAYKRKLCRITNTLIQDKLGNVYLSDLVDEAATFGNSTMNGRNYQIVFQCRVFPNGVKSPIEHPTYYTVENPQQHIRPYRILVKEI